MTLINRFLIVAASLAMHSTSYANQELASKFGVYELASQQGAEFTFKNQLTFNEGKIAELALVCAPVAAFCERTYKITNELKYQYQSTPIDENRFTMKHTITNWQTGEHDDSTVATGPIVTTMQVCAVVRANQARIPLPI